MTTEAPDTTPVPPPQEPDTKGWSFETKQVHAGTSPDPTTNARATPIYQTTSVTFRDSKQRVAALEGGIAAVALASGQAAETLTFLTLASAGDHIVSSASLYGGTYNLLHYTFPKLGINVTFVDDPDDLDAWRAAATDKTRLFFAETLGNPRSNVLDVQGVADVAHEVGVPLVVDNTVPTPYLLRPLEHGADIVIHSATKFLGGHGTTIGGVVVDGGTFDFGAHAEHHPSFFEPDPSYHGLQYWPALGQGAFAAQLRVQYLRDIGAAISPFSSFLLIQGIETLSLRIERHTSNAQALAEWLEARDEVEAVHYAGLPSSPWYANAQKYLPRGAGAIVSFELRGGVEAGRKFVDGVELFSHLANIGDVRSLIIHPASTTHSQLSETEQGASGVTPGLVRLSVGIEALEDLKADLEAGFRASKDN
jgi:O-acetylhomoserine (thiol)-lyase